MAEPVVAEIAAEYADRLKVVRLDADESASTAAALGVSGLPTFILYKGGQPVERVVGFLAKSCLVSRLMPYLA
jgi:thioredoxin-like negative regulator of GroEL